MGNGEESNAVRQDLGGVMQAVKDLQQQQSEGFADLKAEFREFRKTQGEHEVRITLLEKADKDGANRRRTWQEWAGILGGWALAVAEFVVSLAHAKGAP